MQIDYSVDDMAEAIKTVLQALDNSIPKQVIEKRIEALNNYRASLYKKDLATEQIELGTSQNVLVTTTFRDLEAYAKIKGYEDLLNRK